MRKTLLMLAYLLLGSSIAHSQGLDHKGPPPAESHLRQLSNVNVVTGSYHEEACDLVIAGIEPISYRRFYDHLGFKNTAFGHWRINPECFMLFNFEFPGDQHGCIGDQTGSILRFERREGNSFHFDPKKCASFCHGAGGQSHPLNLSIDYKHFSSQKDRHRFAWEGTIKDGSGRKRIYRSEELYWKLIPITPPPPHQGKIIEERKPNGHILRYEYETYDDHAPWGSPHYFLPKKITAYDATGKTVLGFLNIHYDRKEYGKDLPRAVKEIHLSGSDQRNAFLYHRLREIQASNKGRATSIDIVLQKVHAPGKPVEIYDYRWERSKTYYDAPFLYHADKDSLPVQTAYDPSSKKVLQQSAPVGPDGAFVPIARYFYHKDHTIVLDAYEGKTISRFNKDKRITDVEHYLDNELYSIEKSTWDPETGNLLLRTLEDASGKIFRQHSLEYDASQNVIAEKSGGETLEHTIYRTYSDDGFNLLLTETYPSGKTLQYTYKPKTNLVTSELTLNKDQICKRVFFTYMEHCAVCLEKIEDDGYSEDPEDLTGVTYRHITKFTPKQTLPCYGLPQRIDDSIGHTTHITYHPSGQIASHELDGALTTNIYDKRERLSSTTDPEGHTTTFTYDSHNNLTSRTGKHHTTWQYDKAHRPITITTDGLTTTRSYDCLSRLTSQRDPCGRLTRYTYDALSRLTTITHPDGSQTKRTYDVCGNITSETDPNGHTTHKTYDFRGNITSITYPDGSQEHFTYTPEGNRASHTNTSGTTTTYTYDIFDHVIATQTRGKHTSATYTPFHCLSETDASGITTTYTYDIHGRKTSQQTLDKLITYTYDSKGRLETQTEGDTLTHYTYNNLDQLIEKTLSSGETLLRQESYRYDADGNRTQTTNSKGTTFTEYDALKKPIKITDPLGNTTTIIYTYHGNLTKTTTRPDGVQTIEALNFRDHPLTRIKKDPEGNILSHTDYTYDLAGNKLQEVHHVYPTGNTIIHTWTYNSRNEPLTFLEADTKLTTYTYDDSGRLSSTIKPDGTVLSRTYDAYGRLSRHTGPDFDEHYTYDLSDHVLTAGETTRAYDSYGNLIRETLATNLTFCSTYDPYGRRTSLTLPDQTSITYTYLGPDLHTVTRNNYTFTYTRDLEGLPTQIDTPLGPLLTTYDSLGHTIALSSPHTNATYTYDTLGRLTQACSSDPLGQEEITYTYDFLDQLLAENDTTLTYDSLHNRLKKDADNYDVNTLCQVTHDGQSAYTYDVNGNLLRDDHHTYTYDSRDRLITVDDHTYTYDAFNRRLSKNDTLYYWDRTLEIGSPTELRVLGTGFGAEIGASLLLELDHTPYIPLHDHRGNLIVLLDLSNTPIQTLRYTAFGEHNATTLPWTFSSKRYDPESSLIYFGRRYYNPALGRWLTPDPAGFADGPNLYAYVHNNPLAELDVYGLLGVRQSCSAVSRSAFRGIEWTGAHLLPIPYIQNLVESVGRWGAGGAFRGPSRIRTGQSEIITIPGKTAPGHSYTHGNGILTSRANAIADAEHISQTHGDVQVDLLYHGTNGFLSDLIGCGLSKLGMPTTYNKMCASYYATKLQQDPNHRFTSSVHSRASIQMMNTGKLLSQAQRDRIDVIAYGPATLIPENYFGSAVNNLSKLDMVGMTNPLAYAVGLVSNQYNINFLSPSTRSPLMEHGFLGATYAVEIERRGYDFKALYFSN